MLLPQMSFMKANHKAFGQRICESQSQRQKFKTNKAYKCFNASGPVVKDMMKDLKWVMHDEFFFFCSVSKCLFLQDAGFTYYAFQASRGVINIVHVINVNSLFIVEM